ncbi:putative holin-like toxin [Enterococcus faecalis]|nr:putative holin-like toxin [Enterococcus faecalis]MCD4912495.1 putative holin-like toxin [Enterococcus faecalis]RTK32715.1 putative holin-like toxin [Enterococcus faecalis]HCJ1288739.1 putative holin-like toxin [Enterococcus faecalis]HCT6702006.1 putative holin-like toxin [Enterococcus faecalis]
MRMNVLFKFEGRRNFLTIAEALGLMIGFGTYTATLIFGILSAQKNVKK